MVPEVQTPWQGPDTGRPRRDVDLQLFENTALSRGIIGKSAPLLAEMTIRKSQDFLRGVTVLGIDADIAALFGRERGRLRAAGTLIGDFDLLIGATALHQDLTLLTNNRSHFERIDGLSIESA
jgi:tRNA(fMet)-specific endonuclease VapC